MYSVLIIDCSGAWYNGREIIYKENYIGSLPHLECRNSAFGLFLRSQDEDELFLQWSFLHKCHLFCCCDLHPQSYRVHDPSETFSPHTREERFFNSNDFLTQLKNAQVQTNGRYEIDQVQQFQADCSKEKKIERIN